MYQDQVRTEFVHQVYQALSGGSYVGGPVRVEQTALDTVTLTFIMHEEDGTRAEYEVTACIEVSRRPRPV